MEQITLAGTVKKIQKLIESNSGDTGRLQHIADFLNKEIDKGGVNAFPIHEYWLDIGHMDEYEKANREIKDIF